MIPGSASPLLLSSAGGYNLTNSLRFRKSASAYLNRTPASAGNQKTFTFSTWLKRGGISSDHSFFTSGNAAPNPRASFEFTTSDTLYISFNNGSGWVALTTSAVYRDPSAWYHIVVAVDTTQATSTNRVKLYVNGSQVTAFSSATYPNQNDDTSFNNTVPHSIGSYIPSPSQYLDGYMTEINMIDGQALTPSSFGQTSTTTGVWIPKKYTGTYGTNGFYLPFTDNSALTTSSNVGLGKDFSGNANYWTTNNISITAGTTYDSMTDVPTLTSATAANYSVLNPISNIGNGTISGGNLNYVANSFGWVSAAGTTFVSSGKWYYEVTLTTFSGGGGAMIGVANTGFTAFNNYAGSTANSWSVQASESTTNKWNNNSSTLLATEVSAVGDVFMLAYDVDAAKVWFGRNGTWYGSGDPAAGTNAAFTNLTGTLGVVVSSISTTSAIAVNCGQRPFTYTPPSGFVRLNTFNLPTPTIGATASTTANKYFNAITYTGNGGASSNTTQNITTNFYPDLTWVKGRDSAFYHRLTSTGLTQPNYLSTNSTDAEGSLNDQISALASTYFQVKAAGSGGTNQSGLLYVGWAWNANSGSTVSNAAGSITSTVSANTTAGFSIVTYTGNGGTSDTVGHGLGVAPSMIIYKVRSNALRNWIVYHVSLGSTRKINLNLTDADEAENGNFGGLSPTSTTFGVGYAATNGSSETFVAYCFAQVAGYSAFGSYAGNSSTDGPFVYTGFRPRFVLLKIFSGNTGNWLIVDSARNTYNVVNLGLNPDAADAEFTTNVMDFTSNGFKLRSSAISFNGSGCNYIYMAFAENPFKYANAR
jgi:hypothetical protein